MATTTLTPPSPKEVLPRWLDELRASDRAKGTIRRYKSAVESFLAWYERCERRPLTFATLTPIALVGYRNEVQRTQGRATSTVNGHLSALRAWCAWLILRPMPCCVRPRLGTPRCATMRLRRYYYRPACAWMSAASSL